jgi:hypothetical protein
MDKKTVDTTKKSPKPEYWDDARGGAGTKSRKLGDYSGMSPGKWYLPNEGEVTLPLKTHHESWENLEGAQLESSGPIKETPKKSDGKFQGVNQSYTGKKRK